MQKLAKMGSCNVKTWQSVSKITIADLFLFLLSIIVKHMRSETSPVSDIFTGVGFTASLRIVQFFPFVIKGLLKTLRNGVVIYFFYYYFFLTIYLEYTSTQINVQTLIRNIYHKGREKKLIRVLIDEKVW